MPQSHTLKTMYEDYQETVDDPLSYEDYREVCELYNIYCMDKIIDGYTVNLGSYLSTLSIIRIERNYSNPAVNWKASNEYKQELIDQGITPYNKETAPDGEKWLIYYTDDWYCRFYWNKSQCKVRNKSVYSFHPTRGLKGNKTKLKEALDKNPLQYKKYKLHKK